MRLLQVAVVVPTLREISDPPLRVSTGLDEHPARRWTSWRRLGQCEHARPRLVVVTIATQRRTHTTHATLIALTVSELRRLFDAPVLHSLDTGGPCWHGRDGCDHHWAVQ